MLSQEEIQRYQRQILFDKINRDGQEKLKQAKVLVIGCGGLGSAVLYYLACAGVGTIGAVDSDKVELSNLNRQILYFTSDIGKKKIESVETKLKSFNPFLKLKTYEMNIEQDDLQGLVKDYDLVVDCVDNFKTRYIVNKVCYQNQIPMIEAGVMGFEGFVFTINPPHTPCFNCFYKNDRSISQNHEPTPVIGATAGTIGSLQAAEVIKFILKIGTNLLFKVLYVDLLSMQFDIILFEKDPECPVCNS